jgi:hypothetical protein
VYRTGLSFAGKCPHCGTTKSGGRKPPVVREHPHSARNARCCRCVSALLRTTLCTSCGRAKSVCDCEGDTEPRGLTYHGGLTPAALVHVRSCSANGANPRWNVTSCTKSGRRKPTGANVTHPPVGNAYQQRHPFTRPGVSGVSQLCDASFPFGETRSPLPVRYRTTAG